MAHLQAVRNTLQAQPNDYSQLSTYYDDLNQIAWGYMHSEPRPCFTSTLLTELIAWWGSIANRIHSPDSVDTRYVVLASSHADIYNLGGDLNTFHKLIIERDYDNLLRYAQSCIEVIYLNAMHLSRSHVKSISLVQGDALGGGLECALSCNALIAERGSKMGFPEILFNLFPGMGAMTFLGRKIGHSQAEKIILSGKLYSAEEMFAMGVVDVLAEKGEGEMAVYEYIRKESRQRNGTLALRAAREISQPIIYEELMRITELWVDAALRLEVKDLRMVERLVARQNSKASVGATLVMDSTQYSA
jgi:DSF synthase